MLSRADFRDEMEKVVNWLNEYFEKIKDYPVKSQVKPGAISDKIEKNIPLKGISTNEIISEINDKILPGITHWQHPNFHAYFPANSSVESVMAETITAGIGAQCMMWLTSPAAAELEEQVMNWLKRAMGIPYNWEGVIQDTASTATLTAILSAREVATNFTANTLGVPNNLRIYCSAETHSSIDKAVAISGIGTKNLIKIDVNPDLSINTDKLNNQIIKDKKAGLVPACVVSSVGTTGTVAIDSVAEISRICEEHQVWHHIDAAYAGSVLLLPEYQYFIEGIEHADSFVFNPHKWLFTNFDCSAYFVKNSDVLIKTFNANPEYLKYTDQHVVKNYKDWGIPLGRRFRALKLWWVIKSYGLEELQKILRKHINLAEYFVSKIKDHPELEIIAPPILNFCCIRWNPDSRLSQNDVDQINSDLLQAVNNTGDIFISHTRVFDRYGLRFVFGNTYLEKKDVDEAFRCLEGQMKILKKNISNYSS